MSYNFEENIKQLSHSNNIDDIRHEWLFLGYVQVKDRCICNRSIKNCYYFYNKITKKFITAGSSCQKKLKLDIKKPIDIATIIDSEKGDYKEIKDFVAYSNYTKARIIQFFNNKLDKFKQYKTLFDFYNFNKLNKYINLLRYLLEKSEQSRKDFKYIYNQFVNYKKTCIINTWKEVFIRWNKQEKIKKERIEMEKKRFEAEKKAREEQRIKEIEIAKKMKIEKVKIEKRKKEIQKQIERKQIYEINKCLLSEEERKAILNGRK